MLYRSNPNKLNEAILAFGDVHGQVNALLFSAATMALFDRPSQPAGSKQGNILGQTLLSLTCTCNFSHEDHVHYTDKALMLY